jgi:hypothetical protein
MGRSRVTGVMMLEHVHAVKRPSGKINYYYHPFRNTPKEGQRVRLPDDPRSAAFWEAIQKARNGPEPGGMTKMIDAYFASPHFGSRAVNTRREYSRYLEIIRGIWGDLDPRGLKPMHIAELRDQHGTTPAKANNLVRSLGALYAWGIERGFADDNPTLSVSRLQVGEYEPWPENTWTLAMRHRAATGGRPEDATRGYSRGYCYSEASEDRQDPANTIAC